MQLSEKDPNAEKRKDDNDRARMDDEMIIDAGANKTEQKISDSTTRRPENDTDPLKRHTSMQEKK